MEWLPILLVVGVLAFYALNRVFGNSGTPKRDFAKEAEGSAETITDNAEAELEAHNEVIEKERDAIEDAKDIDDEAERLKALADLGNNNT
jgi:hypothetical protein